MVTWTFLNRNGQSKLMKTRLSYGIISRTHQEYVSPQEQTDCPACVQLYLPSTRAQSPLFHRDKDAARQDIPSCERENLLEKMRVCPERDKPV